MSHNFKVGDRVRLAEDVPGRNGRYLRGMAGVVSSVVTGYGRGAYYVDWDDGTPSDTCFFWATRFEPAPLLMSPFDAAVQAYISKELGR